jgi:hypothetical protein
VIDLGLRGIAAPATNGKKRRSTRIFQPISLSVYARNRLGNAFKDSTTAMAVNCHGCLYSTRQEYQSGSWVTLEIPAQENSDRPRAVRAQVRYVRLPQSPRDLYQVGVELEAPGNIWGIKSPPEDWLRFPASVAPAAAELPMAPPGENGQKAAPLPAAEPRREPGKPTRVVVSPDQLLRALEGKLQQSAERAVASAVAAQLGAAVNQAAKAIENFVQASVRRADEQCAQYREKLVASAQEALLERIETNLAEADAHLRSQLEGCVAGAQQAAERLERSAAEVQPALAKAQEFLGQAARDFQERFSATLRETASHAVADFDRVAAAQIEQRLARLAEQAENARNEAMGRLDAKAGEVRLSLETTAGTALADFHVMARNELNHAVDEARQRAESALAAFAADTCANWEATQNACLSELTEARQQEIEEFRRSLDEIRNASMVAAVSAVSEHSRALLASLAQGTAQPTPQRAEAEHAETEAEHAAD